MKPWFSENRSGMRRVVAGLFAAAALLGAGGCFLLFPGEGKNSVGMAFVLVPAGEFTMGCGESDDQCPDWEKPRRRVTISRPFYLGRHEVTQAQWVAVMGENPSEHKGDEHPVENVSWDDAQAFIRRLNQKEGTDKYRLPSEAEWEYAARAGAGTKYAVGDDAARLGDVAWYWDNSHERTDDARRQTHPVGEKQPNPWGLYDMYGNVWEWVEDRYGHYVPGPATNPRGPAEGATRVLRGGSWNSDAGDLRSSARSSTAPSGGLAYFGFRLAFFPDRP